MANLKEITKEFKDLKKQAKIFEKVQYSSDCEIKQARLLLGQILLLHCASKKYADNLCALINKLDRKEEIINELQQSANQLVAGFGEYPDEYNKN